MTAVGGQPADAAHDHHGCVEHSHATVLAELASRGSCLHGVDGGTADKIVNGCFDSLEPPMDPEIIELSLPGKVGRSVIVVRVHADRAPRPVLMAGSAPGR
jgi:hypothetical protein